MNLAEQFARAVMAHVLADAKVIPLVAQSHGEHDFDIAYTDGHRACVEVASVVDAENLSTSAAILSRRHGGDSIATVKAGDGWYVTPHKGADIGRLRRELDACLASLDQAGIRSFDRFFVGVPPAARSLLEGLKVEVGDVVDFLPRGMIHLGLPSDGGWVDPGSVNIAVTEAANRPDNLRKMAAGSYDERHFFVFIDDSADKPHAALFLSRQVAGPIALPEPISHVWVGTFLSTLNDVVIWRAANRSKWRRSILRLPASTTFITPGGSSG